MTRGDLQPKADEESVLNGEVGHVCKRLVALAEQDHIVAGGS